MSVDERPDGIFCAVTETTERVLAARRLQWLNRAAAVMMDARTADDAIAATIAAADEGHPDIPFVGIYLSEGGGALRLRASTANVAGALPATLDALAPASAARSSRWSMTCRGESRPWSAGSPTRSRH